MSFLNRLVCKIAGNHKYSYFSDQCIRCGKLKSSRAQREKEMEMEKS